MVVTPDIVRLATVVLLESTTTGTPLVPDPPFGNRS
jgi:hypothetical protein